MKKYTLVLFAFLHLGVRGQSFSESLARAQAGDSDAMVAVAEAYTFGLGAEVNEDSSRAWVKRAAEKKNPAGMFMHGSNLTARIYSEKDYAEGVRWLKLAADTNQVQALLKLTEVHSVKNSGTEADKYYNLQKAFAFALKADSLGEKKATLIVAEYYLAGKGVAKSDSMAVVYFTRSAVKYQAGRGQLRLGDLYISGRANGAADPLKAWEWYKKAYENKLTSLDDRSKADVGMHHADQLLKQAHNLMLQSAPVLPPGAFNYRLQKVE